MYRVFDLEKKIVERVADVTVEDVTEATKQIRFPLPLEEEFEESSNEELQMTGPESDDDFINVEENVIQDSSGRSQKKRGRPVGSRSY